jgi:hypothetical protein
MTYGAEVTRLGAIGHGADPWSKRDLDTQGHKCKYF